jgi:Xaa-Pro aminopeptidase
MAESQIQALYVTNPENRYYLSGFTGSAGALLVCQDQVWLLTDSRYVEQALGESPLCQTVEIKGSPEDYLPGLLQEKKITGVGLDGQDLGYNEYLSICRKLDKVTVSEVGGMVERLRITKDEEEISKIKEAARIADEAFAKVLQIVKPGLSERRVALELEFAMKELGAEDVAFPTIVASGGRSALPHGIASEKLLEEKDLVTVDFGAVYRGYHSDCTRTVVLGEPDAKQEEIYQLVLKAQVAGVEAVKSGMITADVDRITREIINNAGYGQNFGHGTGHGLGLQVHENPKLSPKDQTWLLPGMIVTIEPGIYIPDWGGVRIEDTVLVTENGCEILTSTPKNHLENILGGGRSDIY